MPQMCWIFQLFHNNPAAFAQRGEPDIYEILEEAYESPERGEKTAELRLRGPLHSLDYVSREFYKETVAHVERVISENEVGAELSSELEYYKKLYRCYDEYRASGGAEDFYALCKASGI